MAGAPRRAIWHIAERKRSWPFCGGRRRSCGFADYAVHSPLNFVHRAEIASRNENDLLSVQETRKLLRVLRLDHVKKIIHENGKQCVSYKEFLEICMRSSYGTRASDEEASRIARELEEAGVVLNFRGRIYLQPEQVAKAMGSVLIPLGLPSEDDPGRQELMKLVREKTMIDQKAHKQVQIELSVGLGFLILQTVGFFRLTFWELSWDVMEPIVFHVTSFYMICGYTFSLITSRDLTHEGWLKTRFKYKQRQLMRRAKFDVERFIELQNLYKLNINTTPFPDSHGLLDLLDKQDLVQRANP